MSCINLVGLNYLKLEELFTFNEYLLVKSIDTFLNNLSVFILSF